MYGRLFCLGVIYDGKTGFRFGGYLAQLAWGLYCVRGTGSDDACRTGNNGAAGRFCAERIIDLSGDWGDCGFWAAGVGLRRLGVLSFLLGARRVGPQAPLVPFRTRGGPPSKRVGRARAAAAGGGGHRP